MHIQWSWLGDTSLSPDTLGMESLYLREGGNSFQSTYTHYLLHIMENPHYPGLIRAALEMRELSRLNV
jgi:hypothetical protein